jgi:hypothetical protein
MSPEDALKFIENSIEPKLQEMGDSYVVLLDNNQYIMSYNGDLGKIAYMLGQVLQDIVNTQKNSESNTEYIQKEFIKGYDDPISSDSKEAW